MINVSRTQFIKLLGKRLRKLRESKGMSQEALAKKADVSMSQIGRIERGEVDPYLRTLNKLSNALKIYLQELFDF